MLILRTSVVLGVNGVVHASQNFRLAIEQQILTPTPTQDIPYNIPHCSPTSSLAQVITPHPKLSFQSSTMPTSPTTKMLTKNQFLYATSHLDISVTNLRNIQHLLAQVEREVHDDSLAAIQEVYLTQNNMQHLQNLLELGRDVLEACQGVLAKAEKEREERLEQLGRDVALF